MLLKKNSQNNQSKKAEISALVKIISWIVFLGIFIVALIYLLKFFGASG